MRKLFLLVLFLGLVSSCGTKQKTVPSSKEATRIVLGKTQKTRYKSLGNGVADIELILFENQTFSLRIESISQPGTKENTFKIYEKGTFEKDGKWNVLNFIKPNFSLESIFDPAFSNPGDFEIEDEKVKIDSQKDGIMIWGIFCEKK